MKVLSLNTWQEKGPWRERWEIILRDLKKHDADIAGLQEVFNMEWAEEVRKRSGYPYLAVSGEHSGLIFLSKFKPLEQECLILKARSPNEDYNRYAFYVLFDTGKEKLALFNTHLSWKADDQAVRLAQASELAGFVRKKAGQTPAIILGDFNTAPDTAPVSLVRDSEGWTDTFEAANPWAGKDILQKDPGSSSATPRDHLTWDYRNPYAEAERSKMAERRIDYIFVTQKKGPLARIKSSGVVFNEPSGGVWPSDHFGVLTEFQ